MSEQPRWSIDVPPEGFLQMRQEVLARQPFSMLIGAELTELRPGHCVLELPITDKVKQQDGFVHGGVVSYLSDNALTYAGGTAMRAPVSTAEHKVNYLRPAIGERLIARAQAVHVGKQQAVCRCDVFVVAQGEEKLCAIGQGTIARRGNPSSGEGTS